jgi:ElaB/YqjD/DUF883 family membrane-anchored ribosome-binding protein
MSAANPTTDKVITPVRPGMEDDPLATMLAQKVEHAHERAGELARRVKEQALVREGQFEDYVTAHPVKSVLVSAGIGAGVGLLVGALLARR